MKLMAQPNRPRKGRSSPARALRAPAAETLAAAVLSAGPPAQNLASPEPGLSEKVVPTTSQAPHLNRTSSTSESDDILERGARSRSSRRLTAVVSLLTVALTLRYIIWRCEVNDWHVWWLSVPLLLAEIFTALHVLGYQYTVWPRKEQTLNLAEDAYRHPIYIFIPTVNEGDAIVEQTVLGALAARDRYLEFRSDAIVKVILCNDGLAANMPDWQSTVHLAESLGIECITRTDNSGAKAGNIENARRHFNASGECLIVVLDADQVAEPEFLLRTVAPFGDPSVGWVQTRQYYRNQESRVARWAENQASLFYDLICPGKSAMNACYICGTNVVIRATVLDEIGGFPQDSITEDFAASIRTHQGWRSVYLKDTLARGLGPMDLSAYYVQQSRWARGTIGVLRSDWKRVFAPSHEGLTMGQRLQYLLSGSHYLCGLRDFVFLGSALICLWIGCSPIKSIGIGTIADYLLPYIFASQLLLVLQLRSLSVLPAACIGYGSFPTLVVSFFEALGNRRMRFKVTPKSLSRQGDLRAVVPHAIIALICIVVVAHAFAIHTALTRRECIPLFWVVYAVAMLTPSLLIAKLRPAKKV